MSTNLKVLPLLFAVALLAACGSGPEARSDDGLTMRPFTPEATMPQAQPAALTIPAAPSAPAVVDHRMTSIPVDVLIDKLVDKGGCRIGTVKYREIGEAAKTGGHIEITCVTTDSLSMDKDL